MNETTLVEEESHMGKGQCELCHQEVGDIVSHFSVRHKDVCPTCLKRYKDHPRCSLCGILTGRSHIETELFDLEGYPGYLVCQHCQQWAAYQNQKRIQFFLKIYKKGG